MCTNIIKKKSLPIKLLIGFGITSSLLFCYYEAQAKSKEHSNRQIERIIAAKPININHATENELSRLKGVGSKRAKAIVAYRSQHGMFKNLRDITKVPGLSSAFLDDNRGLMTLNETLY